MMKADRQVLEAVQRRYDYREVQIGRNAIPVTQEHSDVGSLLEIVAVLTKRVETLEKTRR